ncbi:MAG: hypothetical protein NT148_01700, partial [Candidatus Nealsonbacteria bacterium]|nr:hypothetical protein [Candidatus Nealsonbacteria bacterium]
EDRKKSERKKQSKKTPESEPAGGKEKKPRKRRPTAAERRQKEDEEWKKEYDTFLNEFVEIERMRRNSHNSTERYQSCEAAKEKAERTRSTFEQAEAGRQKYEDQEAWLLRKFKEWRFKEEREAQRRQKNEEWHKICRQAAQAEAALNQARAEWEQLKRESADMYNRHRYRQINVHFKHFKEPTQGTWECGKYDLEAKWKVDEEEVPGRFIEALEREKHCRKAKEKMAEEYKAFIQAESIIKENEKNKSWIQKQLDKILNKSDEEEYIIKRKNIEIKKRKIDQDWQQAEYLLQELVKETDQDTINARHTRDWKEFKEKHNLHF